jgi:hypothetical protein
MKRIWVDCRCRTDGQRPLSIAALAGENEKNVFEWRKGQRPKLNRVKSGGTSFDAATEYVNSSQNRGRWDGIIYLTDGECCKPMASRVKRGWILGSGCNLGFQTDEMQASMDKGTPNKGAWRWVWKTDQQRVKIRKLAESNNKRKIIKWSISSPSFSNVQHGSCGELSPLL